MANLTSWHSRNEVDRFRNDIDRMFHDFFTGRPFGRSLKEGDWAPGRDHGWGRSPIML